ncbi:MAG: class I SAM-dependent methyltransferase, partial [Deltaproteobacteria bacterium]|nr:class I SAM-dependent methyltransferase [Deltaproteobacteria bacterium]
SFFPKSKKLTGLNGLILGCNYGKNTSQVALAQSDVFKELTVVDIAEDLLDRQHEVIHELDLDRVVNFACLDLNKESLPNEKNYDLIHAWGTIHHIKRLEGLFSDINDALCDDGIFCMREYVGPSYLQFADDIAHIVDSLLAVLPDDLKRDEHGNIKNRAWRPTVEEIVADDPSEAVRSDEILPIVEKYLDVLACRMTGGTILNPLLHAISGNFERDEAARSILKILIVLERTLIESGVIPSDYVYLIAKKKAPRKPHVDAFSDSAT